MNAKDQLPFREAFRSVLRFYPRVFFSSFITVLPSTLYILYTMISRMSMFCNPSDRTANDRFFLIIDNVVQNCFILCYVFLPWWTLYSEKLQPFKPWSILFCLAIGLWSLFKPFTLAYILPAGVLLVFLYLFFTVHMLHFSHFIQKRMIIKKTAYFQLYVPWLIYLVIMEFYILPMYFSSDDSFYTRLTYRIVIVPSFNGVMMYMAKHALKKVKTSPHDKVLLIALHNATKLLVLRILVTNAGSFLATAFMLFLAGLSDIIWRFTARFRDQVLQRLCSPLVLIEEFSPSSAKGVRGLLGMRSKNSPGSGSGRRLQPPSPKPVQKLFDEDITPPFEEADVTFGSPLKSSLFPIDDDVGIRDVSDSDFDDEVSASPDTSPVKYPTENDLGDVIPLSAKDENLPNMVSEEEPPVSQGSSFRQSLSIKTDIDSPSPPSSPPVAFLPYRRRHSILYLPHPQGNDPSTPKFSDADECHYIHLFLAECLLDVSCIIVTSIMKLCSFYLFDTTTPVLQLTSIMVLQLSTATIPDIAIIYLISRHRFKAGEPPLFNALWTHFRHKRYSMMMSLAILTGTLYFTIRFYLSLQGSWHNFNRDSIPDTWNERCTHVPFGPF
ncbi:hypothetical protein GEMRC1_002159 [Eukaryota sp. GEM-RC1]